MEPLTYPIMLAILCMWERERGVPATREGTPANNVTFSHSSLSSLIQGFALLSLSVSPTNTDASSYQKPSSGRALLFFSALYIVALGHGSFQPISLTYGADQFDVPGDKTTFFNLYLGLTNFGMVISSTVIAYFENNGSWALGFWMCTVAAVISFLILLAGVPISQQYRPGGNFLSRIAQVVVAAFLKCRVAAPSNSNELYEIPHDISAIRGSRKILHSENFRWLDKAAVITGNDVLQTNLSDRWRLCTVTQVEEVKCVCRLLPFWVCAVFFNAILLQMSTLFTEQGDMMDNHFGTFRIPPASMNLFNVLTVTLASPIYSWIVAPCIRWYRRDGKDITSLQRMGVGLVVSMVAMSVAALVEMKRLRQEAKQESQEIPVSMSIFWLVPQYVLQGFAQVLFVCGHMDFNYSQSPDAMRSFGSCLALSSLAVGSFLSTLLVSIVTDLTIQGGNVGWIPEDLNQGHLDYFYWLLVGVLGCTLFAFLICAHWYTYIQVENWQLDDSEEQ
eukprot:c26453_g1_i1 orf=552-2063(+)